jgi:hypothetical protein
MLLRLALNSRSSCLNLHSSWDCWDYRCVPQCPAEDSLKKKNFWAGGVAQEVQCLLCKCKVLGQNPFPTKKKKKKKLLCPTHVFIHDVLEVYRVQTPTGLETEGSREGILKRRGTLGIQTQGDQTLPFFWKAGEYMKLWRKIS